MDGVNMNKQDNANGAGMEPIEQQFKNAFRATGYVTNGQAWELADAAQSIATRLLAESQEHNAKLEAQVERFRQALRDVLALAILQPELHYLDNDIGTQTPDGIALLKARAALKP